MKKNQFIFVLTFHYFILLNLSLFSMNNPLLQLYQTNGYKKFQTPDNCAITILDKGRYIAIESFDSMQISFDPKTNHLRFKNSQIKTPFNCFAQIEGKIIYGLRINTEFYVTAQEVKPKICEDKIIKYPIILVNPNISIYAPLCTFIKRTNDNKDTIVLKGPIDALAQLDIVSTVDSETKLVKNIHIYPKNGASFVTSEPIVCFVPPKTPFFTTYNSIEQNNNL